MLLVVPYCGKRPLFPRAGGSASFVSILHRLFACSYKSSLRSLPHVSASPSVGYPGAYGCATEQWRTSPMIRLVRRRHHSAAHFNGGIAEQWNRQPIPTVKPTAKRPSIGRARSGETPPSAPDDAARPLMGCILRVRNSWALHFASAACLHLARTQQRSSNCTVYLLGHFVANWPLGQKDFKAFTSLVHTT